MLVMRLCTKCLLAGWVSGIVQMPAPCTGTVNGGKWPMTAYECSVCLDSTDPISCIACSKGLYTDDATCGYARGVYWGRNMTTHIGTLRNETCVACACYTEPADALAKERCVCCTAVRLTSLNFTLTLLTESNSGLRQTVPLGCSIAVRSHMSIESSHNRTMCSPIHR